MNIRKRLIKVAGKILDEVVSDIQEKEMTSAINVGTEEGLKKYIENHPNYREDTVFIVNGVERKAPPKEKKNPSGNDGEKYTITNEYTNEPIEMNKNQYKLHTMATKGNEEAKLYAANSKDTHPYTLETMAMKENVSTEMSRLNNLGVSIARNENSNKKTLNELLSNTYDCNDSVEILKNKNTDMEIASLCFENIEDGLSEENRKFVYNSIEFNEDLEGFDTGKEIYYGWYDPPDYEQVGLMVLDVKKTKWDKNDTDFKRGKEDPEYQKYLQDMEYCYARIGDFLVNDLYDGYAIHKYSTDDEIDEVIKKEVKRSEDEERADAYYEEQMKERYLW